MTPAAFSKIIRDFYKKHGRDLPWRHVITPYSIVVSEIMLQQTQTPRVVRKFDPFIRKFPSFAALAKASTMEVLREWQGLGYNRRGLNLHKLAKIVTEKYAGKLPRTYDELLDLPGIGPNTAGSILAFAFNIPHPFIETNIRSVYIHFFFSEAERDERSRETCERGWREHEEFSSKKISVLPRLLARGASKRKISDGQLFPFIEKTLLDKKNQANPREWYYALMDYGVYLKRTLPNPSRRSAHHVRQSKFEGSNRQLRSRILRFILSGARTLAEIERECIDNVHTIASVRKNVDDLEKEGFIVKEKNIYLIR